jgi:hypothetical protein
LFTAITTKAENSEDLSVKVKLSRKEYYSRMSRLMKTGLVKRKNGKHYLTAFGKVIFDAELIVGKAVDNNWRLRAIDSIDLSNDITMNERSKLIDSMVDDLKIKEIVLRHVA